MGLVLHIGFGKCGSSTLQSWLCRQHEIVARDGRQFQYCAVTRKGDLLTGAKLRHRARLRPAQGIPTWDKLFQLQDLKSARAALEALQNQNVTPLLSSEGWISFGQEYKKRGFWRSFGSDTRAIVYVRPQTDWLNSAWWQWFRWTGEFTSIEHLWQKSTRRTWWTYWIDFWSSMPGISKVDIRILDRDIVGDFCSILDIDPKRHRSDQLSRNAAASPALIKLYGRIPALRPRLAGAPFDLLFKNFGLQTRQTPWIIDQDLAARIIKHSRADNERLLTLLDEKNRKRMKSDPRWWDASAYADKQVWKDEDSPLSPSEVGELLATGLLAPARYLKAQLT